MTIYKEMEYQSRLYEAMPCFFSNYLLISLSKSVAFMPFFRLWKLFETTNQFRQF